MIMKVVMMMAVVVYPIGAECINPKASESYLYDIHVIHASGLKSKC